MRAILRFLSRGKGLFALRKNLKVPKNAMCTVERDPDNLSGEFVIEKVMLGEISDACREHQRVICDTPLLHILTE